MIRFSKITHALQRYAWDHDDQLPLKLSELVPQYITLDRLSLFYPREALASSAKTSLAGWESQPELINTLSDFVYLGAQGIPHGIIAYGREKQPNFGRFERYIIRPDGSGSHVTQLDFDELLHSNDGPAHDCWRQKRVIYYEANLHASLNGYRNKFGSYPRGTNASVMRILRGENPAKKQFYSSYKLERNKRDEDLDPWGIPYLIESDGDRVRIKSAGSNRRFDQLGSPDYDNICSSVANGSLIGDESKF